MDSALRVTHIITGLSTGGAEMMLYRLLSVLDRRAFVSEVVSLAEPGPIGSKIAALGIPVRTLGMRRGLQNPILLYRLMVGLGGRSPHVVQTWMYHANLIGGLVAKGSGRIPVIWNIRHSTPGDREHKPTTRWIVNVCSRWSRWLPTRIVCCSEASYRTHADLGYAADRMIVIPNGFDLNRFRPDPEARHCVRQELGVPKEALLIGQVGRFRPQKDHGTLIAAAARLSKRHTGVYFLLCGEGISWENAELAGAIQAFGLRHRFRLLGPRDDMARINAALDIACSSSYSEGFSNALGEAMACGIPCVATAVGDSAVIVGSTGRIAPPHCPAALSGAWEEVLEMGPAARRQLGMSARLRIERHFSLPSVAAQYERLYQGVVSALPARGIQAKEST